MAIEFKLPELGEGVDSADISRILVSPGDEIEADQTVMELETEKAVADLPCPHAGKVAQLLVSEGDTVEKVHQIRKRCKKLRGLIRLVRPEFRDYKSENAFFRDAAGGLSHIRDARSVISSFDRLVDHFQNHIARGPCASVREQLVQRRAEVMSNQGKLTTRLDEVYAQLQAARQRAAYWKIGDDGFSAVEGGLRKTFRRGRQALAIASQSRTTDCAARMSQTH